MISTSISTVYSLGSNNQLSDEYCCLDVSRHLSHNIFKTELIIPHKIFSVFPLASALTQVAQVRHLEFPLLPYSPFSPAAPKYPINYQYLLIQLLIYGLFQISLFFSMANTIDHIAGISCLDLLICFPSVSLVSNLFSNLSHFWNPWRQTLFFV